MGRTRHPGAVSRAGQTECKAQSQGLTAGPESGSNSGSSRPWLRALGRTREAQRRDQNDTWEKVCVLAAQGRREAGRPLNPWGQGRQEEAGEFNGKPGRVQGVVTQDSWGWHLGAHREEAWPHRQREVVCITQTGWVCALLSPGIKRLGNDAHTRTAMASGPVTSVGPFSHKKGKLRFMTVLV